MTGPQNQHFN